MKYSSDDIYSENKNVIEKFFNTCIAYSYERKDEIYNKKDYILRIYNSRGGNAYSYDFDDYYEGDKYVKDVTKLKRYDYEVRLKRQEIKVIIPPNIYDEYMDKIKIYVDKQYNKFFKRFKGSNKKLHLSIDKVDISKFKSNDFNYHISSTYYNPGGLWYSCDVKYYKELMKNGVINKYVQFDWLPINVYILDLKDFNIKNFDSCEDIYDFSDEYKNNKKDKNTFLNWKKIKKDYDGIEMCPFINYECLGMTKKEVKEFSRDPYDFMTQYLVTRDLTKKQRSLVWSMMWKGSSGVVLKNFNKINYEMVQI